MANMPYRPSGRMKMLGELLSGSTPDLVLCDAAETLPLGDSNPLKTD